MRAKTILAGLFLVSLASVVIIYLNAVSRSARTPVTAQKTEILVAATPLSAGTLLRAQDVAWQAGAGTIGPADIIRTPAADRRAPSGPPAEILGAALRVAVQPGAPIAHTTIIRPGDRDFLPVVLSPGKRAIAVPVSVAGASSGLLFPGDMVDLILTQSFKQEAPLTRRSVSETVVYDLRVLAVDSFKARAAGAENGFGRVVTIEVTPEQAEQINVAKELGKLSLTLRGSRDPAAATRAGSSAIRATWAGDVSPALTGALYRGKPVAPEPSKVEIIRGGKSELVTLR